VAVSNTALECDGILSDFASLSICQHGLCWPSNIGQREQAGKESGKPDGKETRWQGTIVRIDKEKSTMSIRGGQSNMSGMERQVSYDSSTHWTKQGKPAEQSEFKEGSFVIVLGHADEKGNLHASRIDLRLPR